MYKFCVKQDSEWDNMNRCGIIFTDIFSLAAWNAYRHIALGFTVLPRPYGWISAGFWGKGSGKRKGEGKRRGREEVERKGREGKGKKGRESYYTGTYFF